MKKTANVDEVIEWLSLYAGPGWTVNSRGTLAKLSMDLKVRESAIIAAFEKMTEPPYSMLEKNYTYHHSYYHENDEYDSRIELTEDQLREAKEEDAFHNPLSGEFLGSWDEVSKEIVTSYIATDKLPIDRKRAAVKALISAIQDYEAGKAQWWVVRLTYNGLERIHAETGTVTNGGND